MSKGLVVKSFAELPQLLAQSAASHVLCPAQEDVNGATCGHTRSTTGDTQGRMEMIEEQDLHMALVPPQSDLNGMKTDCLSGTQDAARSRQDLLAELEAAGRVLIEIAQQDQAAREAAHHDLERYDALAAAEQEARQAAGRAQQVRQEAEKFLETAFVETSRAQALQILETARRAEGAAAQLAEKHHAAAEALASRPEVARLLAERSRQEEAERARATEAERERRLQHILGQARLAIDAGRLDEAKRMLTDCSAEWPDDPEVASLREFIRRRELARKVKAAEDALWAARREYRHDPAAVLQALTALDVEDLPDFMAQQVFGAWAQACARLCRERGIAEPLRYAPVLGRGAVIARDSAQNEYVVVSSLGMGAEWQAGDPVEPHRARLARPLR